jgi:translocator protein
MEKNMAGPPSDCTFICCVRKIMKPWLKLLISITVPLAAGTLAGLFTARGVNGWYRTITRPDWNPPDAVFAPVWTMLYILMGIAFYLVWQKRAPAAIKQPAITFWIVQLILNALWSFLFFSVHAIGWALTEILVLWLAILITIFTVARVSKLAAWLLVPYISWVSFATILTYTIWQLNR